MEISDCILAVVIVIVIVIVLYVTHKDKACPPTIKYVFVPGRRGRPMRWCPYRQMWI